MLDARLGYRNKMDPEGEWKEYAKSFESRNLNCDIHEDKKIEGYYYNCSILPLFDLGSLHHDYYLLNLRYSSVFSVLFMGQCQEKSELTLANIPVLGLFFPPRIIGFFN